MSFSSNLSEMFLVGIHEEAKKVTSYLRAQEVNLISVLQKVDEHKVFRAYKYPSFFKYLTLSLGFSENRAYALISVVRATRRFKKLDEALKKGKITVSKVRRIAAVLTESNVEEWIHKCHLQSHRSLEKLVAGENPEAKNLESARYVSPNQVEVRIILTEQEFNKLKRAQGLLASKAKKVVGLRATVLEGVSTFLDKTDPVVRALRVKRRDEKKKKTSELGTCTVKTPQSKRVPVPASVFHEIQLRDQRQCQATLPNGEKCLDSRWTHLHHVIPVKDGGQNSVENLTTLCSGCHAAEHWEPMLVSQVDQPIV